MEKIIFPLCVLSFESLMQFYCGAFFSRRGAEMWKVTRGIFSSKIEMSTEGRSSPPQKKEPNPFEVKIPDEHMWVRLFSNKTLRAFSYKFENSSFFVLIFESFSSLGFVVLVKFGSQWCFTKLNIIWKIWKLTAEFIRFTIFISRRVLFLI